jgi:DNA-binding transcriptional LysR family regulator
VGLTERPDRELPAITVHQLHDQELLAVLPPDAVAAHRGIAMADLARRALVATPPGTSTRRLLDEAFSSAGVDPTIAVETAQREAILPLVLAGAGAALLPRPLAETAAALGAVVRPLRPKVVRSVVLIHRTGTLAPAAQAFVTLAGRLARGREDAAAPNLAAHRSRR